MKRKLSMSQELLCLAGGILVFSAIALHHNQAEWFGNLYAPPDTIALYTPVWIPNASHENIVNKAGNIIAQGEMCETRPSTSLRFTCSDEEGAVAVYDDDFFNQDTQPAPRECPNQMVTYMSATRIQELASQSKSDESIKEVLRPRVLALYKKTNVRQ